MVIPLSVQDPSNLVVGLSFPAEQLSGALRADRIKSSFRDRHEL